MDIERPPVTVPTGPAIDERTSVTSWSRSQVAHAWLVHGFTALGIVAAMLALRDVLTGYPRYAILWLLLTLVIDGVDGPIARALMVGERVPNIDGYTLDLIIDYVTCVIVPATFMYEFHVVQQNNYGIAVLCVLVFTSALWFARRDMMTEDNWFHGFPAAWNLVAPVMFLLGARTQIGDIVTVILSLLSLTNLPFPHIMRARLLRPLTLLMSVEWISAIIWATVAWPDPPYLTRPLLIIGCVYFAGLALLKAALDVRAGQDAGANGHPFGGVWNRAAQRR